MPNQLKNHHLLSNGIKMPLIGYGTFPYKEELLDCIPAALNLGYELIDTSDDYHNYHYVGEALNKLREQKRVLLQTKISWPVSPATIRKKISEDRKQLKLGNNSIDILLLHFPYPYVYIDAWKEMEKLYLEGVCSAIGVCNFEIHHLKRLMRHCSITPMVNQFELHPLFQQRELCSFCKRNNIVVVSYSPVCRMNPILIKNHEIDKIAIKYKKNVIQIILRWHIEHGYIPIPASSKLEHIVSNYNVFDFELTDEDMESIDNLDCGMRIRYNPNTMYTWKQRIKCFIYHIKYLYTIFMNRPQ